MCYPWEQIKNNVAIRYIRNVNNETLERNEDNDSEWNARSNRSDGERCSAAPCTSETARRRDGSEARERRQTRYGTLHVPGANEREHSVTGWTLDSKRAEHAHIAVASQSRRGGCGSWFSHFVALIRFERVARERARRRCVASRRVKPLRNFALGVFCDSATLIRVATKKSSGRRMLTNLQTVRRPPRCLRNFGFSRAAKIVVNRREIRTTKWHLRIRRGPSLPRPLP